MPPTGPPPNRKSKQVKIAPPKSAKDALLGNKVAFSLGSDRPEWLKSKRLDDYGEIIDGDKYLLGTVSRQKVNNNYVIEWEATLFGKTAVAPHVCFEGVTLHKSLHEENNSTHGEQHRTPQQRQRLSRQTRQRLMEVTNEDEIGDCYSSDSDSSDSSEGSYINVAPPPNNPRMQFSDIDYVNPLPQDEEVDVLDDGMVWKTSQQHIPPPINKSTGQKTRVKEEYKKNFNTPLSSFLSFIPLDFWKQWTFETNRYAKKKLVDSKRGFRDVTLQEMMVFMALLMEMAMAPIPGRRYTWYWEHPRQFPFTRHMSKNRFVQFRSYLHMVDNDAYKDGQDAVFKARPLLNVLKKTLGKFVVVGSEVALDESSFACRSSYGRSLIFFNSTKPTGKYHFRFYLLCEMDYFNCVRLRMLTRDDSDCGDGANDRDYDPTSTVMSRLVLDMCKGLKNSGRVVNTDNFYTSPFVYHELLKQGIYARGTCRGNRSAFPKNIQFTNMEAAKGKRGDLRMATCSNPPMVAYSWLDGNPVNLLTTADGTEGTTVLW